jgi:transposase
MTTIALVGIDLGKRTFHVHAQDAGGRQVLRRQMNRVQLVRWLAQLPPCTVAFEACCGAHWLGWKLHEFGHTPRMIDARRVRPFVAGNKHDFADAEAICEAARRPAIRSIAPKTPEQLGLASLHRVRDARVAERTACINQTHAFLLEFGMGMAGSKAMMGALPDVAEDAGNRLPSASRRILMAQYEHYQYLCARLDELDRQIQERLKDDELAIRLQEVPGIGPITASALCAEAAQARQCASSRDFAASIGLTPRQHSTGGKSSMLGITKRGDGNLRRLLVQCARVLLMRKDQREDAMVQWARRLSSRRHTNVVACALAAKLARILWAILVRGQRYQPHPVAVTGR